MYVIKNNAPYVIKNKNNRTSSFSLRYQEQEQCLLRHHKQCLLHPQEQCFFSLSTRTRTVFFVTTKMLLTSSRRMLSTSLTTRTMAAVSTPRWHRGWGTLGRTLSETVCVNVHRWSAMEMRMLWAGRTGLYRRRTSWVQGLGCETSRWTHTTGKVTSTMKIMSRSEVHKLTLNGL